MAVAPRLSVNVNKVATLRNSRGGQVPGVARAAQACVRAGAGGIIVHPRADGRYITTHDVRVLNTAFAGLWGEGTRDKPRHLSRSQSRHRTPMA